jgi:hypothetical protein
LWREEIAGAAGGDAFSRGYIFDAGFEFSILHYQFSIPKVESAACKFTWF